VDFVSSSSIYVVIVLVAIMVGIYPIAIWRKMSFTAATVFANAAIFIIYFGPNNADLYWDVVVNLGFKNSSLHTGEDLFTLYTHMYIHADFLHVIFTD
jgi:membrane associated rhomboid family serine protease